MADSPGGGEKSEEPTPKKLQDARDEGQVAWSTEVPTAILTLVGFILLIATGPWFLDSCAACFRRCLTDHLREDLTSMSAIRIMILEFLPLGAWLALVALILFACIVAAGVAQVGFSPSLKPLAPKFEKLNPITGLGRLFGMKGLMRFGINLLKLGLLGIVAWMAISAQLAQLIPLHEDPIARMGTDAKRLADLGILLALVILGIAMLDLFYQRWQFHHDQMMTLQEVKDEYKQSEGDPHVKGKIRQIQREMAQKRMMQEVPKADVVITNPTHVAVALKYDAAKMAAPIVLAKGYDDVAQKIKAIAREHGITLVENVQLARALAKEVEVGDAVPVQWYQAVAEVLAWVYKLKNAGR